MRKIFTVLSISLFSVLQLHAQCGDLSSYTSAGIYPGSTLEFCDQAAANKDLVIVINEDTTLFGFTATVNQVHLDNVTNLPNGMTFTCGTANCDFTPSGGLIKICINFSGNIDDASYGTQTPVITGDIDYNITSGPVTGPGTLNNQTLPYNFEFTVLSSSDASCNATATSASAQESMSIYPNPVSASGMLNVSDASSIEIVDFLGNIIYTGSVNSAIDLSQFNLTSGVYFIKANSSAGQVTKKFVVK